METTQSAILYELERLYVNREVHFEHPDGHKASRLKNLFLFWKLPENVKRLQSVYMITPAKATNVLDFPWEQWVRIKVETEDDVVVPLDIRMIYDWDSYELIRRRVSELFRGKDIDYAYLETCIDVLKYNHIYVPYFRFGSLSLSSPPQLVNAKMIDRVAEPFTVGCGVYILPEGVSKVSVGDKCFRLSSERWKWVQKVTYYAPEHRDFENFSFYVYGGNQGGEFPQQTPSFHRVPTRYATETVLNADNKCQ
jgi:hypothetical protein